MPGALIALSFNSGSSGDFEAQLNTDSAFGGYIGFKGTIRSSPVTCTAVNGVGPYTYLWTTAGTTTPENPTSATTRFQEFSASPQVINDTATCTVTDSLGNDVVSDTVTITLEHY